MIRLIFKKIVRNILIWFSKINNLVQQIVRICLNYFNYYTVFATTQSLGITGLNLLLYLAKIHSLKNSK